MVRETNRNRETNDIAEKPSKADAERHDRRATIAEKEPYRATAPRQNPRREEYAPW